MSRITLDLKFIKNNEISINEFLCLMKIKQSALDYESSEEHYKSLEDKKFIKIRTEVQNDKKVIEYILREKGELLLKNSFTEEILSEKVDKVINEQTDKREPLVIYRSVFKGLKPGSMGDPHACRSKLTRFMLNHPEYTLDQIIKAARLYIKTLNGDYRYLQRADYFIYKRVGKTEESRLAAFLEEISNEDIGEIMEDGWTSELN